MTHMSIEKIRNFIGSLELEGDEKYSEPAPAVMLADGDEAAYVDAGSLVSFVAGVSGQHKSDALNSTLLAQLAANKKFDREKQTVEWYDFYKNRLGKYRMGRSKF